MSTDTHDLRERLQSALGPAYTLERELGRHRSHERIDAPISVRLCTAA